MSDDANWRPIYMGGEMTNYSVSNEGQIRVSNTLKLRANSSFSSRGISTE